MLHKYYRDDKFLNGNFYKFIKSDKAKLASNLFAATLIFFRFFAKYIAAKPVLIFRVGVKTRTSLERLM